MYYFSQNNSNLIEMLKIGEYFGDAPDSRDIDLLIFQRSTLMIK